MISPYISPTFREHLESLRTVFQKLRETGITLKLAKCQFVCEYIDFIGYNISKDGVKPLSTLTETINSFSRPSSKKELKRFLGMIGFYRNFIPNFADRSNVLNQQTSEKVEFKWDDECEAAFISLKQRLCTSPVLAFPKVSEKFYIEVEACDYAVGGILSQKNEMGELHPIAYYSTSLNKSQKNWSPHTKEAYAVLMAVRQCNVFLAGIEFTMKSDHNPLVHIRNTKNPKGKFARWLTELEE